MKRKTMNTHFTIETRQMIENSLNEGLIVTKIASLLKRDRSNISREIIKHRTTVFPNSFNNYNACSKNNTCSDKFYDCYKTCKNIEINLCPKLISSPHVCNGCITKHGCRYVKYYYKAHDANCEYEKTLHEIRSHLHYTSLELDVLNNDFYNLVINTKSIYHSLTVINSIGFHFKISSIYRQIKNDLLRIKLSDLPRSKTKQKNEIDKTYKRDVTDHTYEDYEKHKKDNPNDIEWQMDCVQGIQGKEEPVFLTLQIVEIKFIFIFKMPRQTAEMVCSQLSKFKKNIGSRCVNKILNILLTDNGHEFIKLNELLKVFPNANIFYCHPYSSYEKGSIENNHELIRRIIPQGVSLKVYSQEEINIMCSHINSLYREELDGKCPFDLIEKYISIDKLKHIGLNKINAKDVMLIPELLGEKNVHNIRKYLSEDDIKKANIKFRN